MTTRIEPAALLRLMWLASPALPVGGFAYSEGLEAAVEAGLVRDERQAAAWLLDQLHLVVARSELPVMLEAFEAWRAGNAARIATLDAWVLATRETAEAAQQTRQTGRSLAGLAEQGFAPAAALAALDGGPSWPIAFARAAEASGAQAREAGLAFAFAWAENMVQAAIKAVPLGQSAGQRVLAQLADAMPAAVDAALALPEDERQAHAPMLAILGAQHEVQYSRLFRS